LHLSQLFARPRFAGRKHQIEVEGAGFQNSQRLAQFVHKIRRPLPGSGDSQRLGTFQAFIFQHGRPADVAQ